MNYCLVEKGAITEGPITLPKNWKNISNLPSLSNEDLLSFGWLPVTYSDVNFDLTIQKRLEDTYKILPDKVDVIFNYKNKTEEEIAADEAAAAKPVVLEDIDSISYVRGFLKAKFTDDIMFPDELK